MRWPLVALVLVAAGGCASASDQVGRSVVVREILPSLVQLRSERDDGGRRAGSGVVVAEDPGSGRAWIITTRHLVDPPMRQSLTARRAGRWEEVPAEIVRVSGDSDLALVSARGLGAKVALLKPTTFIADEIWVAAFPWGRRLTLAGGIVSQILGPEGLMNLEGPPRMVDTSVSYGASGGGVFDAASGMLIAIVEGYRTAKVVHPDAPGRVLEVPVPGETTVISSEAILRFLDEAGLGRFLRK